MRLFSFFKGKKQEQDSLQMTGFAFNGPSGGGEKASTKDSINSRSSSDNSDFEVTGTLLSSESAHATPRTTRSRSSSGGARAQLTPAAAGGTAAVGNTIVKPQFTDGVASVDGNSTFSLSKVRISF